MGQVKLFTKRQHKSIMNHLEYIHEKLLARSAYLDGLKADSSQVDAISDKEIEVENIFQEVETLREYINDLMRDWERKSDPRVSRLVNEKLGRY